MARDQLTMQQLDAMAVPESLGELIKWCKANDIYRRCSCDHVSMADMPYYETLLPTPPSSKHVRSTKDCTSLPIPEWCLISEFENGQSGDQQPQLMAED